MAISGGDGSIILSTKVDTSGINKGMSSIKGIVGKVGGVIAAAFSARTLINFGKEAINLASDLQEVQNVVDTAFGSMSYKIEEFSKTAIENFGISRLTAKRTASTYMAMAKGMGIAEDTASDMAITMTGLTADIASFYNMSQERADVILKSVYTGETESLKQLGIVMTEVNLEQFAMSKGITKNIRNMTQQEKTMLRYQFVLEQTRLAQGDFAKTQDSWANQTRILTERWKEMQATFGQAFMTIGTLFLPILNKIVSGLTQVAQMAIVASKAIYKLFTGKEMQLSNQQANSIQQSVENQDALTESVKETAKEQQKLLAGFDEITKLSETEKESTAGIVANQTPTNTGTPLTVDSTQAQQATTEISSTLATIMGIVGVALVALGLLLIVTGHIAWGIGFIIAGATALGVTMATLKSDKIGQDVKDKITAGLVIAGLVAVVLGILLCFAQHWGLGVSLIILGAATIVTAVSLNWSGVKQKLQGNLGKAIAIIGIVAIVIGILLCVAQQWGLGIGLIVSGAAAIATTVTANYDTIKTKVSEIFDKIMNWIKTWGLLVLGVILCITAVGIPLGLALIKKAADNLAQSENPKWEEIGKKIQDVVNDINNWLKAWGLLILGVILSLTAVGIPLGVALIKKGADNLVQSKNPKWEEIGTKIQDIIKGIGDWLKTWGLLVLGIILIVSGVGIPLGLALVIKAGQNLTEAQSPLWNTIVGKVQEVWEKIRQFWNTHIAKYFTAQWWSDLAKRAGNGLINGFEAAVNGLISLFENMINWVVSGLNSISVEIPEWVPNYGGGKFGVNLPYVRLGRVSIPRLAQGAVIPGGREFLAVLGDQPKGQTNIETPLQTMIEAFNIALNQRDSGNQTIVLTVDGDVLFRTVVNKNKDYVNAMGVNPLGI